MVAAPIVAPPSRPERGDGSGSSRSAAPAPARPAREAEKRAKAAEKKRAAAQAALEADIEVTESRLREVEASLANPASYADGSKAKELVASQRELRERLDRLWRELEHLA